MLSSNHGYWERLLLILIAKLLAETYAQFHWSCKVHTETEWSRRPGHMYSEHIYFIGVVNEQQQIVRGYYGTSLLRQEVI